MLRLLIYILIKAETVSVVRSFNKINQIRTEKHCIELNDVVHNSKDILNLYDSPPVYQFPTFPPSAG